MRSACREYKPKFIDVLQKQVDVRGIKLTICEGVVRMLIWVARSRSVKLPWIYSGILLTFNEVPGNIQGNLEVKALDQLQGNSADIYVDIGLKNGA